MKSRPDLLIILRGYLIAIGFVALATWLKYLAQPDIIPANVPILYLLAIVPTAIFFGLGPSILVCVLSIIAFDFFFYTPANQLSHLIDIQSGAFLGIYFLVGLTISYLASDLRKKNQLAAKEILARKQSEAELASYRDQLEDLVRQRTSELEKANLSLREEIVERKKAEEALRYSEQRWATTLASVGDAVIATDLLGRITFMNSVAEELSGWHLREAVARPIGEVFKIVNEYTREKVDNPVAIVMEKGIVVGLANHTILLRKDGTEISIDDSAAPIKIPDGQITGVVLVFRDITGRKKMEEDLRSALQKLTAHFENSPLAIVEFDPQYRIIRWSEEARRVFGWTAEEVLGKAIGEFRWIVEEDKGVVEKLSSEMRGGQNLRNANINRNYRKDGSIIICEWYNSALTDEKVNLVSVFSQVLDVTERMKADEELRRYAAELERANRELESFSYSVSHDLRAPLRTLDGFSEMVLEDYGDKIDEIGKDYLNRIRKASQTMSQLIDDMLKLSRVGRLEMLEDAVNLSDLARAIFGELQATQPERQAEAIIAPEVVVNGDKQLLQILMRNLLENAWKFTSKCPWARLEFGETQQDGKRVYFVKDNGAGFDMKYADRLFQPFNRLHTSQEYTGTGIGLAIVQRVIYRHGGKIWADSKVGKGSTFYFTLEEV